MKCELVSFMISVDSAGHAKAITRCDAHNWTFDGPASLMCPIGRIEEAADKAVARIREAKDSDR